MRWLALLVLVASTTASAAPASNPAFVGIRMGDMGIGCQVADLVAGGPAKEAGVRPLDLIIAIDGVPLASQPATVGPCNVLIAQITGHAPGDTIKLDIRRGYNSDPVAIKVTLSTRAEVLHRRLVGHSLASVALSDADDPRRSYDLAGGHVTVLGWFRNEACSGCSLLFDKVHDQLRERLHGEDMPDVLAATPADKPVDKPKQGASPVKRSFTAGVPLALAPPDTLDDELLEADRVLFVIVDCHGIVKFVAPIAPDSDDADAALDEVLAAAEQLSRR